VRLKLYRGWWYAVWRDDKGTRRTALRTQDRGEAESALADLQRQPVGDTVGDIYPAYLADKGTERANWAWKRLREYFASLRPDQIGRAECRIYTARRRREVGDGTIHTELTFLRAALTWHDRNSPAIIERPSKPPPKSDYLTRVQFQKLLSHADAPHLRLFIILALATAGRATAILQLTWSRVDFDKGEIQLGDGRQRKKGRATVPMNAMARAELLKAHEARTCENVIEYGGGPVLRVVKGFRTIAVTAGMPWCTPHVLRHTAAVWMAEAGVPIDEVAQFLGHSDSRITERVYARYSPGHLSKAASALDVKV
jgi:integrase